MSKKDRVFKTQPEVLEVRNSNNRVRPAKILTERSGKRGRPILMLSGRTVGRFFQELMKYFFIPLVNALELGEEPEEKMSFADRIAFLFGARHRDVVLCVADENFKMPGLKWRKNNPAELVTTSLLDSRILKGTPLVVRLDERMPGRIDIERCDSLEGIIFTLNYNEYEAIYKHLQEVAGCNERLIPPGQTVKKSTG